RYAQLEYSILRIAPPSGKTAVACQRYRSFSAGHRVPMLALLDQPAPEGYAQWNDMLLVKTPGTSAPTRFGASSVAAGYNSNGGEVGASPQIQNLVRRRLMWSCSI